MLLYARSQFYKRTDIGVLHIVGCSRVRVWYLGCADLDGWIIANRVRYSWDSLQCTGISTVNQSRELKLHISCKHKRIRIQRKWWEAEFVCNLYLSSVCLVKNGWKHSWENCVRQEVKWWLCRSNGKGCIDEVRMQNLWKYGKKNRFCKQMCAINILVLLLTE